MKKAIEFMGMHQKSKCVSHGYIRETRERQRDRQLVLKTISRKLFKPGERYKCPGRERLKVSDQI